VIEGPPAGGGEAWELRESRELLDTIITCAPVGFGLLDLEMRFVRVNEELAGIGGRSAEELTGRRPQEVMPAAWGEALAGPFRRVLESGDPVDDLEITAPTAADAGRDHVWLASWYPVRHDAEIVAVGVFVTDITDRVRAERGLQLLFDVGEALDATLGVEERLARLAELVVPTLADFCTIEIADRSGEARRVAEAAVGERPPGGSGRADAARRVAAPLRARGREIGTITLWSGPSGRVYDEADRRVALQLGRRAGLAADNARLYDEQLRIAETLQRSLLPPALPAIPGIESAARYSPMGDGVEVGGDFYDLFATGSSCVAVIGDVCGKGVEAAALTSLLRHSLRALAREGPRPSAALARLNEAIIAERGLEPRFSTVAYARLEPAGPGVAATVASAGHPLPLVIRAGGGVEALGAPGSILGPFTEVRVHDREAELAPGDALVLYTDGVIEARRDGEMFGEERLRSLLAGLAGRPPGEIAGAVEQAVVGFHGGPLADDLAILAVRVL
jgi:PAS domain S-box-containing protein